MASARPPAPNAAGTDQESHDAHARDAHPPAADEEGRPTIDARVPSAPSLAPSEIERDAAIYRALMPTKGRSGAGAELVRSVQARTVLDLMLVNGRPIGDYTPAEIEESAVHDDRNARLKRALLEGVQLEDPRPLRDIIPADEAEKRANRVRELFASAA